jgi:hypothetical protein
MARITSCAELSPLKTGGPLADGGGGAIKKGRDASGSETDGC